MGNINVVYGEKRSGFFFYKPRCIARSKVQFIPFSEIVQEKIKLERIEKYSLEFFF